MPVNYRPHLQYLHPQTGLPVTEHVADYIMLGTAHQTLIIQGGAVYQGNEVLPESQYPAWFWDAFRALTPAARRAVGLELPEDKIQTLDELPSDFRELFDSLPDELKAQLVAKKASRIDEKAPKISPETSDPSPRPEPLKIDSEAPRPKIYVCEECGKEVPTTAKGVHIGRHRRQAKLAAKVNE